MLVFPIMETGRNRILFQLRKVSENMKKRLITIMLSSAVILGMSACSADTGSARQNEENNSTSQAQTDSAGMIRLMQEQKAVRRVQAGPIS